MINMNMSFDSVRDIDSISQISAMDSASQTGNHSVNGGSLVDYKYRSASADALLPRSVSVGELMAQPGMAAQNAVGGHNGNGGTYRRGQFPYAYIRSKLSVLPEEHAGQLSRRESMNQAGDQQAAAHAHAQQLAQHVIYRVSNEDLEEGDIDDDDLLSSVTTRSEIVHPSGGEGGGGHGMFRQRQMALRRKRSLSVADIPVPEGFQDPRKQQQQHVARQQSVRQQSARQPIPPTQHSRYAHRQRSKCEESGYDSDTTRKSSPRGSLKVDSTIGGGGSSSGKEQAFDHFDSTSSSGGSSGGKADDTEDSASSGSEDSGNVSSEMKNSEEDLKKKVISTVESGTNTLINKKELVTSSGKQTIKKPPRKSKLPEATFRTTTKSAEGQSVSTSTTPVMRRFKKHNENANNSNAGYEECPNSPPERRKSESALPSSAGNMTFSDSIPSNLPSLTSKRFKMLRLKKPVDEDLGIVISKKRHPQKGTTGYIIAHIEEEGLVER